ncbi:radical SAM protein [Candidatus Kuenenbacteria bacterium]|nr:radical SAM protein [Candidatus Kuenenbacteria bacterium]
MKIIKRFYSFDGTVKYLLQLEDNSIIETVFYPYSRISSLIIKLIFWGSYFKIPYFLYNFSPLKFLYQHTDFYGICISSQIGCALGCKFCATGKQSFVRNLTTEEIIAQVVTVLNDYQPKNIKKIEITFAGMGESLLNYQNVTAAIKEFPLRLKKFGIEEIINSLMTVGILSGLSELIKDKIILNLFISLHSVSDELRSKLMPIGETLKIREILELAAEYQKETNARPVRLNYTLIKGINDSERDAQKLADLSKEFGFIAQIKMFNPVIDLPYQRVSLPALKKFLKILKTSSAGYVFDISKGISNTSGCGQLKYHYNKIN